MSGETRDESEKARIDELLERPVPWYSNPNVIRACVIVGAGLGTLIHLYLKNG